MRKRIRWAASSGRHQRPALEIRAHLGLARAGVVQHQRRVDLRPPARLVRPLDGESVSEIELDAGVVHDRGERRPAVALEQHGRRELGDPLRDERLRRRHEHQRLLEQSSAAHEQVLLAGALRVVAGVRLVDRELEQLEGRDRQVDVDGDPAAQVAEVVVERQPGLVAHDLQDDSFAVRQIDQVARPRARLRDHRRDRALDLLRGHEHRALATARIAPPAARSPGSSSSSRSCAAAKTASSV